MPAPCRRPQAAHLASGAPPDALGVPAVVKEGEAGVGRAPRRAPAICCVLRDCRGQPPKPGRPLPDPAHAAPGPAASPQLAVKLGSLRSPPPAPARPPHAAQHPSRTSQQRRRQPQGLAAAPRSTMSRALDPRFSRAPPQTQQRIAGLQVRAAGGKRRLRSCRRSRHSLARRRTLARALSALGWSRWWRPPAHAALRIKSGQLSLSLAPCPSTLARSARRPPCNPASALAASARRAHARPPPRPHSPPCAHAPIAPSNSTPRRTTWTTVCWGCSSRCRRTSK